MLGGIANPDGTGGDAPLEREREIVADAHARGLPVLGICLGAQVIAQALGGSAERMPAAEVGWVPARFDAASESDPLLAGAPRELDVQEWHSFECLPPAGAALLAHSASCVRPSASAPPPGACNSTSRPRARCSRNGAQAAADELAERPGCRPRP